MLVDEHEINCSEIFKWTDSANVLQWFRNNYKKQLAFVAHRMAEILYSTTVDQWNHSDGLKNPAYLGHVVSNMQNLWKLIGFKVICG